ncbi:hypothetical protein LEP1GSC029_0056 [Leptospira interrogans str. 2002000626]|uniref:Uncharacterized protein n=1 Tax=Leptospira interrogans str. 2002000626 TaxID=996803 RepID=A0A829D369_LEPIR|nr:hypothetical protein LEP1GSC029_0056 [Leptospira interrogans str. 2002000626]
MFQKEWATVLQKKKETGWGICPVCRNGILQKKKALERKNFINAIVSQTVNL